MRHVSPSMIKVLKAAAVSALAAAVAGCASLSGTGAGLVDSSDAVRPREVLRAMTSAAEWQLANPSKHRTNDWQEATFWAGLSAFAPLSDDPGRYFGAIRGNGAANGWKPGPSPYCVDDYAIAQSYFLLYRVEGDRGMIAPTLTRFDTMLRMPFDEPLDFSQEKTEREWVTCDSLFMMPPALALASDVTGDRRYADLMNRLWWKTTDYLYDKEERLYYRDSRFFGRREANGRKVFWSRGNGWVLAGLARVLQYLPKDYPERHRYLRLFREMAPRIAGLQGNDGYWRAGLLDPASWPTPETSGTGLHIYALAWGVNEGLLDRGAYEAAVRRGWSALVRSVRPDGMLGYVQPESYQPGVTTQDRTEVFGVGAFLLAGSEVYRMESFRGPRGSYRPDPSSKTVSE
ncbi:MAG: glycoside hydrolase family 88 protein [Deltaproteobacteria bacterium]|nr:glycoside hydrolase family 88 protein [Deltaproteobacteria bacterium]